MRKKAILKEEDRNFFSTVVKSIYMNPFCDERREVLCQISPRFLQDWTIAPELNEHISRLDNRGFNSIQHFKGEDGRIMMQLTFTRNSSALLRILKS